MSLLKLTNAQISLTVSSRGGSILQLVAHHPTGDQPLLRPAVVSEETPASASGCFPLVPFGNRVEVNQFECNGTRYSLAPNTECDSHYLHGDGWLNEWQCLEHGSQHILLEYVHAQGVYHYRVQQRFELEDCRVLLTLNVTNLGKNAMPFGLGWHPFFPLEADTQLQAEASGYWQEEAQWLAGAHRADIPADLCFSTAQPLPRRWVNNGFSGWNGQATITWPQHQQQLRLVTEPACPVYFVFVSDPAFEEGYCFDFFCFEPMSHAANGHHMSDLGGLKILQPQGSLSQRMTLSAENMA